MVLFFHPFPSLVKYPSLLYLDCEILVKFPQSVRRSIPIWCHNDVIALYVGISFDLVFNFAIKFDVFASDEQQTRPLRTTFLTSNEASVDKASSFSDIPPVRVVLHMRVSHTANCKPSLFVRAIRRPL
jgi:hypothetical protein